MDNGITALVVAEDERLAQSLQALLQATAYVASAGIAGDLATLTQHLRAACPALVLLALDAGLVETLTAVKAACPAAICVALAGDQAGQVAAQAAGADLALVKGYPAPQLYQAILRLLNEADQPDIVKNVTQNRV